MNDIVYAARLSCMIMFILVGAAIFGHFISVSRVPFVLSTWISSTGMPPVIIILDDHNILFYRWVFYQHIGLDNGNHSYFLSINSIY